MKRLIKRFYEYRIIKDRNIEEINSFLISAFLSINVIGWILPINNISVMLVGLIILIYLLNNGVKELTNGKKIFFTSIIIWFLISAIFKKGQYYNIIECFQYFIIFGICAFIITSKNFCKSSIYKYIMLISILAIPYFITNNFFLDYSYRIKEQSAQIMVISYALVPVIVSSFIVLSSRTFRLCYRIISIIPFAIYTFIIISISSRGAILAIVTYFILRILFYKPRENRKIIKIVIITILFITIAVVFLNMQNILEGIKNILDSLSIKSSSISRMIQKTNGTSDFFSGRGEIYTKAIEDIKNNFFFGNGIATFEDRYNHYIHNILLQIQYEGGIICTAYFLYLVIYLIKYLIKEEKEEVNFLIFIISISLVQLMLSSYYWSSLKFWFLVGYILSLKYKKEGGKHA